MSRLIAPALTRFDAVRALVAFVASIGVAPAAGQTVDVHVAVAANFSAPHERLVEVFESATGYRVHTSVGSTGLLSSQIANGAPFEVFLAADAARPRWLEERGHAVAGTRFTYAMGRLALYGPGLDSVRANGADLRGDAFRHLAIANPAIAPYGIAAEQVLSALGILERVRARIVKGENLVQAYQFVRTGAAELALIARSQLIDAPSSSYWAVPESLHEPIVQDALLLEPGRDSAGARAYLEFLRSTEAREVIRSFGYEVPTRDDA